MADQVADLARWARRHWPGGDPGRLRVEPMAVDGSLRLFVRLAGGGRSLVAMSNPDNPPENRAWRYLADLLAAGSLPVPRVLAQDLDRGRFLMQDLGRRSLQEAVRAAGDDQAAVAELYQPVLAMLARLQLIDPASLDPAMCFDGPRLTPGFLRQREAGYFMSEFVGGVLGLSGADLPAGLERDLEAICHRAGEAGPLCLVHRDFQSRNIVVDQGRLGLVDFQGARLGPSQYDLAALLGDPYVDLEPGLRHRLLRRYLELRSELGPFDAAAFLAGWPCVALCRAMQALGAYAFLTRRRGRGHFAAYVAPGLRTLIQVSRHTALDEFAAWRELVEMLHHPDPEALAPAKENTP